MNSRRRASALALPSHAPQNAQRAPTPARPRPAGPPATAARLRPGERERLPVLRPEARNRELKRDLPLACHIQGCGADLRSAVDY